MEVIEGEEASLATCLTLIKYMKEQIDSYIERLYLMKAKRAKIYNATSIMHEFTPSLILQVPEGTMRYLNLRDSHFIFINSF